MDTAQGTLLQRGPRLTPGRVLLDLGAWVLIALTCPPLLQPVAVLVIGFVIQHDLLVHGHEATHGLASRNRTVNGLLLWGLHALFGLSGRAYRAFHLRHHTAAHTDRDPERKLYGRLRGWDYLLSPVRALWVVNRMPVKGRTVDLLGAVGLHGLLLAFLGWHYLLWVLAPMLTGLPIAVVLRALTEHHGAPEGEVWQHTRGTRAHWLLSLLWSHVDHHLEHHLRPDVPWYRLPALRAQLAEERAHRGIVLDDGLIPTALHLLQEPAHTRPGGLLDVPPTLAHRLGVRWMRDLLQSDAARQHLYSLYFHGEAYEQLHPLGVWIDKLQPHHAAKLRRQFDDEARHAAIFERLLTDEDVLPRPVEGAEDVGWYKLHHVVPEVCAAAGRPGRFTDDEAARYCGFLYLLERRSIGDLIALREAARLEGRDHLADAADSILTDEQHHAAWTWNAMCELCGSTDAAIALYTTLAAREQHATHGVLAHLLTVFGPLVEVQGTARLRWQLMALTARTGAAVPRLPPLPQPEITRHAA